MYDDKIYAMDYIGNKVEVFNFQKIDKNVWLFSKKIIHSFDLVIFGKMERISSIVIFGLIKRYYKCKIINRVIWMD